MVYLFLEWIDFNNKNSFLGFMYLKFFNVDISKRQNTKNLGMKNENDWKFAHDDDAHHYGAISLHLVCAREISRATENTDHHVRFKNGSEKKKRKEKIICSTCFSTSSTWTGKTSISGNKIWHHFTAKNKIYFYFLHPTTFDF